MHSLLEVLVTRFSKFHKVQSRQSQFHGVLFYFLENGTVVYTDNGLVVNTMALWYKHTGLNSGLTISPLLSPLCIYSKMNQRREPH